MELLTQTEARRFSLWASGLQQSNKDKPTQEIIRHLGYIQIDTISVVERAHHHVLWSRQPQYKPELLAKLEKERHVFEYWSHAASYLPMQDYRYSLPHKLYVQSNEGHWYKKEPEVMRQLLDRIKGEGALMSRDFEKMAEADGPRHPKHGDLRLPVSAMDQSWVGDPVKRALRQLFMEGRIMVASRTGFQKSYDLTERVVPTWVDTSVPSREEYLTYLIRRYARSYGLFTAAQVAYMLPVETSEILALLKKLTEAGEFKLLQIKGLPSQKGYYADAAYFDQFSEESFRTRVHILSPFDNFLIQRKRIKELFDFDYTLECYVPAAKRLVGYFSLPIIYGDRFIAQIDLKADRANSTLVVQNLVWMSGVKSVHKYVGPLLKRLESFKAFNKCQHIDLKGHLQLQ